MYKMKEWRNLRLCNCAIPCPSNNPWLSLKYNKLVIPKSHHLIQDKNHNEKKLSVRCCLADFRKKKLKF